MTETIGHRILNEIIRQGMVRTDSDDPTVLIWNGNAPEQLECLVINDPDIAALRNPS